MNKIFAMDCLEGMRRFLKDGEVDVIVTSPPYNLGIKYSLYDDAIPREEYLDWIEEVGKECKRVLKDDGSFFLNLGYKSKDLWVAWEVAFRLRKHFVLQNIIHWIKSITINNGVTVGHFKPINSKRFINKCHEFIFHFTKNGDVELNKLSIGVPYQDKSNIKRWKKVTQDLRDRGDVWFIPYKTIKSREKERPHPATFPPELPMMCIKLHGLEKTKLVLDPFMGIGNTAVACKKLEIDYMGFEIDPTYVKIAEQNLQNI